MGLDYLLLTTAGLLLLTALLSILGNGTILLTVIKNSPLRKKDSLYLISALAVADLLTALANIPYAVELFSEANGSYTQRGLVLLFSQNLAGARMNQILTLFLGLDRLYAVFCPVKYRTKNHLKFAQSISAISYIMGFVDAGGTYLLQQQQRQDQTNADCLAINSNDSPIFSHQNFRLFSNFGINIVTVLVYIILFWKIRRMSLDNMNENSRLQFRQANDTVTLILLASLAFITVPCMIQVFDYLEHLEFLMKYGSIISIGNCLNGAANVVFYAWKHRDFNTSMKKLCLCSSNKVGPNRHLQDPKMVAFLVPLPGRFNIGALRSSGGHHERPLGIHHDQLVENHQDRSVGEHQDAHQRHFVDNEHHM